MPETKLSNVCN